MGESGQRAGDYNERRESRLASGWKRVWGKRENTNRWSGSGVGLLRSSIKRDVNSVWVAQPPARLGR